MSTTSDFDLGDHGGGEGEDHKAMVRKLAVLDNTSTTRLGSGVGMSRMTSDHQQQAFQSVPNGTSPRPGVGGPPWMVGRPQGDSGSEDISSTLTMDLSLKEEAPTTLTWDRPAPTNRSHEDPALLRKAAVMYGSPLQARRAAAARANSDSAHPQLSVERSAAFLPFYNRMKVARRFENGMRSPQPQHQQSPNVGVSAGTKKPGTAQLTIFYAGMVNVYDDVPFDKAQAIMLLAGTGNAWPSSNFNMVGGANRGPRPFVTPSGGTNQPMSRAFFPAPQPSTPASSSGAPATLPDRQVPAAVELPQARKASLARFLEKRKDRVRKGPYSHPNDEAAKSDAMRSDSRENSPSNIPESSGQPPLSPTRKESNNNGNESRNYCNESETYGNESTSSQPPTPPRPSPSDSGHLQQFEISARVERPVLSPSRYS